MFGRYTECLLKAKFTRRIFSRFKLQPKTVKLDIFVSQQITKSFKISHDSTLNNHILTVYLF